jgi:hypothetical protein
MDQRTHQQGAEGGPGSIESHLLVHEWFIEIRFIALTSYRSSDWGLIHGMIKMLQLEAHDCPGLKAR